MILITDDLKESELKIEIFNYSYASSKFFFLICNPFFSIGININILFSFFFKYYLFLLSIASIPFLIISTIVKIKICI